MLRTAAHRARRFAPIVLLLSLLLVGLVGAGPARAAGNTYYVATNGSDSNTGSITSPWRTIKKALTSLYVDDTLYVRGGTYVERIISPSIRPGAPYERIKVVAYPGERPIIKGLLWMSGAQYWRFDGINVTWDSATGQASEHMVKFTNGSHWTFKNAEVWGAHSYAAIYVASTVTGQPTDWRIAYNCVHDTYPTNNTNQDQLLYINAGLSGSGGLIKRNILFNATNGMGVKLGGPSESSGGSANVTVRYNTIYNTSQSILVAWRSAGNDIHHNLMDQVNFDISPNYGNVRGYELSGTGNIVHDSLGYQAKSLILNDPGFVKVADGGGNVFPSNPKFDSLSSCDGFHPATAAAQTFGRYGVGA
jgi:hypothetical protein